VENGRSFGYTVRLFIIALAFHIKLLMSYSPLAIMSAAGRLAVIASLASSPLSSDVWSPYPIEDNPMLNHELHDRQRSRLSSPDPCLVPKIALPNPLAGKR
jgi:hypothetical protein